MASPDCSFSTSYWRTLGSSSYFKGHKREIHVFVKQRVYFWRRLCGSMLLYGTVSVPRPSVRRFHLQLKYFMFPEIFHKANSGLCVQPSADGDA